MNLRPASKLIISLLIPLAVGGIAGIFTSKSITGWFEGLNAPSFRPPNWLFGPVWTVLYILMGISLYIVWVQPSNTLKKKAINIFAIQLTLNFIWSFMFFYFHTIGIALFDITALWLTIVLMIVRFRKVSPTAAFINLPYICWVTFALVLNLAYYRLN